ncbi:IPT/TIG domain-containing protein, partial [Streptomyces sp. NPDC001215]
MPISPSQGSTGGGTLVTITGTNLSNTSAVTFGTKAATSVTNVSPTQVTAVSPAGSGTVGVTVTTPGGTSNPLSFFYLNPPFKSSLSATSGPLAGGNSININGVGLSTATSVSFGGVTATPTVVSDSVISVTVPAGTVAGLAKVPGIVKDEVKPQVHTWTFPDGKTIIV